MDTQPTPTPQPSERPMATPEQLLAQATQQVNAERAPMPRPGAEIAPTNAPAAGPAAVPAAAATPGLSASDVAAAIAAVPAPAAPVNQAGPAIAGDVDVIEPEWVTKAEEVVAAHQGDPFGEEAAVERLQQDYLQKRYGMKVSDADENKPEVT